MRRASQKPIVRGFSLIHRGIDYAAYKEPVQAPQSGKVSYENQVTGGMMLNVTGKIGVSKLAHLSKRLVKSGSLVKEGQDVAISGNSGIVFGKNGGYHLHESLYVNGKRVDPRKYWTTSVSSKVMPTHDEIKDLFSLAGLPPPTSVQLNNYSRNHYTDLSGDIIRTLVREKRKLETQLATEAKILAKGKYLVP